MPKSLADLRASREPSRPERSTTLCLAPHLVAEAQSLAEELTNLKPEKDEESAPKRAGQGESPRATEIRERLGALLEEMAEFEGELRMRANWSDGDWRRWCNKHPARDEGEPGHDRDQRVTFGYCNADDLLDVIGDFVSSWNGEPLEGSDWPEALEPRTAPGDKAEMAKLVVAMYEGDTADFRRWRNVLQGNLKRLNGFASPATSASATSDSTDGSLDESSEATTETGTE